jgi:hypothetical protein
MIRESRKRTLLSDDLGGAMSSSVHVTSREMSVGDQNWPPKRTPKQQTYRVPQWRGRCRRRVVPTGQRPSLPFPSRQNSGQWKGRLVARARSRRALLSSLATPYVSGEPRQSRRISNSSAECRCRGMKLVAITARWYSRPQLRHDPHCLLGLLVPTSTMCGMLPAGLPEMRAQARS